MINIVTRPAADTQGPRAVVTRSHRGGQESAPWGGRLGAAQVRFYGMAIDRASTRTPAGADRGDASSKQQAGFRADLDNSAGQLTVEADVFTAGELPSTNLAPKMHGGKPAVAPYPEPACARRRARRAPGSRAGAERFHDH